MVSCSNCGKEIDYISPTNLKWLLCSDCMEKECAKFNKGDIILDNPLELQSQPGTTVIKADSGKLRLDLVPLEVLIPLAKVREYGLYKYGSAGSEGWQSVEKERYLAALLRHLVAYQKDNNALDEESGLPAIYHVLCNAAFLAIKHLEEK